MRVPSRVTNGDSSQPVENGAGSARDHVLSTNRETKICGRPRRPPPCRVKYASVPSGVNEMPNSLTPGADLSGANGTGVGIDSVPNGAGCASQAAIERTTATVKTLRAAAMDS